MTWIFVATRDWMEQDIASFIQKAGKSKKTIEPQELHCILVNQSLAGWTWYLEDLSGRVKYQTDKVTMTTTGIGKQSSAVDYDVDFTDRQAMRILEEKIQDAAISLRCTMNTIEGLIEYGEADRKLRFLCSSTTAEDKAPFAEESIGNILQQSLRTTKLHYEKAETLLERMKANACLLAEILAYENDARSDSINRILQSLAEESQNETRNIKQLTERSTRDAAAIRILTIVTLIYLPANVVAGFFSTQFVTQEQHPLPSQNIQLCETCALNTASLTFTSNAWIYAAVTIPLTALTTGIWYIITRHQEKKSFHKRD